MSDDNILTPNFPKAVSDKAQKVIDIVTDPYLYRLLLLREWYVNAERQLGPLNVKKVLATYLFQLLEKLPKEVQDEERIELQRIINEGIAKR